MKTKLEGGQDQINTTVTRKRRWKEKKNLIKKTWHTSKLGKEDPTNR